MSSFETAENCRMSQSAISFPNVGEIRSFLCQLFFLHSLTLISLQSSISPQIFSILVIAGDFSQLIPATDFIRLGIGFRLMGKFHSGENNRTLRFLPLVFNPPSWHLQVFSPISRLPLLRRKQQQFCPQQSGALMKRSTGNRRLYAPFILNADDC